MDGYAPPNSYLLYKQFHVPDHHGGTLAIAVSAQHGRWIGSLYGILITIIFSTFWALLVSVVFLISYPGERPGKGPIDQRKVDHHAMHVVLAGTPLTYRTPFLMFPIFKHRRVRDSFIAAYSVGFIFLAIATFAGGKLAGTFLPSNLMLGNVAPVNVHDQSLFSPDLIDLSGPQAARISGIQSPSALRALGAVDAAKVVWKKNFQTQYYNISAGNTTYPDDRGISLTYGYVIDGVDLGLQRAGDLRLTVNGTCQTRYDWLFPLPYADQNVTDRYNLWVGEAGNYSTGVNKGPTRTPFPVAAFYVNQAPKSANSTGDTTKYAIMYGTAHRHSVTNSIDPWFATEALPTTETRGLYNESYWVRDRRPPLACSEYASWEYHGHYSRTTDLGSIPGLPIPEVLINVITTTMSTPILYQIGLIAQQAALLSRFTYTNRVIDAEASAIDVDVERLAWAAYVFTRNMISDTTGTPVQGLQLPNVFLSPNGTLRPGSGDFVLKSTDVAAMSVKVVIAVPVFLLLIIIVQASFLSALGKIVPDGKDWKSFKARLKDLDKTEMEQYVEDSFAGGSSTSGLVHGQRTVIVPTPRASQLPQDSDVEKNKQSLVYRTTGLDVATGPAGITLDLGQN